MSVDLMHVNLAERDKPVEQRDRCGLLAERCLGLGSTAEFAASLFEANENVPEKA
jgi:hypothetical protein